MIPLDSVIRRRVSLAGCLLLLALPGVHPASAAEEYALGPESLERRAGVPKGRVESFTFDASQVFPQTTREGWVYIPAQYDGTQPAALMVFQDGGAYVREDRGDMRVPIVFDNLIAEGAMPVTIGVFVNPGKRSAAAAGSGGPGESNRSFEYDSLGGAYARFLIDELLPFVVTKYSLKLTTDPDQRAVAGMSSGAICAFTVAWERPDQFRRVLSHIGSFTNIRGGHAYPALIRKTERKPLRVFLQDGRNDLNNLHGNWPLANQEMASALAFAGYDHRFEFGDGAHSGKHGGAILPQSLRWLWRPALAALPAPQTKDNLAGDEALSKVLEGGGKSGDWELVGEGYAFTDGACSDAEGNVYFSDLPKGTVYRVPAAGGAPVAWLNDGPKVSGLKFGPDGQLYACTQGQGTNTAKQIVVIDPATRKIDVVATDVKPNDLIVSRAGFIYFTQTEDGQVIRVPIAARRMPRPPAVAGGINKPNGISLSADQRWLVVSEYGGTNAWTFRVNADGSLSGGEKNLELRTPVGKADSGGDGLTTDAESRYWITSHVGLQVFDAGGRLGGVVVRPQEKGTVSCAFGGPDRAYLYVCSSDKVFRRRTLTRGAVIP